MKYSNDPSQSFSGQTVCDSHRLKKKQPTLNEKYSEINTDITIYAAGFTSYRAAAEWQHLVNQVKHSQMHIFPFFLTPLQFFFPQKNSPEQATHCLE